MASQQKVFSNLIWRFAERCGAQLVSFVVTIVIARIVDPAAYGTVAMITVFTEILNVFVDSGMAVSLIQKRDADQLDFSTVFYANTAICLIIYGLLYGFSPIIADFYNNPQMTALIRVAGLTLVISGLKNVQQAYVSRNLMFKKFFFSTLTGTILAAIVGIAMAYMGYGVWALVVQSIVNPAIDTFVLWLTVKWRPTLEFSWKRLKGLFSFGWKMLVSALIDTTYRNLRNLFIGKMYTPRDLAFFNRAQTFPQFIVVNVNSSIDSILLPVMAEVQDEKARVKELTRTAMKTSIYVMAPLMMGLCFVATPVVRLLLTDKWLECVPYMRILCITYMFYPVHTANLNAIKALGRSDLFLKLEIIKKVMGVSVLLLTIRYGVMIMTYSFLFTSLMSQIINSWPNKKLLDYGYLEQLKDILPSICLAVFMGGCVYLLELLNLQVFLTIAIQVFLGALIYILGSIIFKLDSFYYLIDVAKPFIQKLLGRE